MAIPRRTAEHRRLDQHARRQADWKKWGPYVADRAWGTVREDYSATGEAWDYFPHDHARSRAYRWNEDGLAGVCNRFQNTCLGLGLWNGQDPILKERLFGLSGPEGNHGEDVKEYYYYLDSTPTHSYMRMLYKYPQVRFPYEDLVAENRRRGKFDDEYELIDALRAAFEAGRYFDVFVEYAKVTPDDLICRIRAVNRSTQPAPLHVLPQIWHRNTWSWGHNPSRPRLEKVADDTIVSVHRHLGTRHWYVRSKAGLQPRLLFAENETNHGRLHSGLDENYKKDAFHEAVVHGASHRVKDTQGTKAAAWFATEVAGAAEVVIDVRFGPEAQTSPFRDFDDVIALRREEADAFYATVQGHATSEDERNVQRQAFGGLMWSKQYYHYSVELWLDGDPDQPKPPASRKDGRNRDWRHLYNNDVLSMPDKWEYPWFAAWDLAFHAIPIAMIDPQWAKRQIVLLLREWYLHPNGAMPAYEWAFGDVNPPVHAWAAWQVYKISRAVEGKADTLFLQRVFQKLLLNFTWWVNRKDHEGRNAFQGGFLGLDNIGVFDRSAPLPTGGSLEQADGTAWMAMFCLNMLGIALELATVAPAYEDIATKFFEHFVYITNAFYEDHGRGVSLWHEDDGFYYDLLRTPDGAYQPLRIRSFVGLIPLFAVGGLHPKLLDRLPHFRRRVEWFLTHRPKLIARVGGLENLGRSGVYEVAIADRNKLQRILDRVFDPEEFLSDYGLRSLSRKHLAEPYELSADGRSYRVAYEPGESRTTLFGGNSNWRGPIWFPINYLMVQALRKYHLAYGDSLTVALPGGERVHLGKAADELTQRLANIFLTDASGRRPVFGGERLFDEDPHWKDHIPFYEYFHGDTGKGIGASHQTGWTALIAKLLHGPDEIGLG